MKIKWGWHDMIPKMRTYYYGFKKFKCEEYDIKMRRDACWIEVSICISLISLAEHLSSYFKWS